MLAQSFQGGFNPQNPNPPGMVRSDSMFGGGTGNNQNSASGSMSSAGGSTAGNPLMNSFLGSQQSLGNFNNPYQTQQPQQPNTSMGGTSSGQGTGNSGGNFLGNLQPPGGGINGLGPQTPLNAGAAGQQFQPLSNLFSGLGSSENQILSGLGSSLGNSLSGLTSGLGGVGGQFSGLLSGLGSGLGNMAQQYGNALSGTMQNLGNSLTNYYQNFNDTQLQPQLQADLAQRGLSSSALGTQQLGKTESNLFAQPLSQLSSAAAGMVPGIESQFGGLLGGIVPSALGLMGNLLSPFAQSAAQLQEQEQLVPFMFNFQNNPGNVAAEGRTIGQLGMYNAGANYQNSLMANAAGLENYLNMYGPAGVAGAARYGGGGMVGGTPGFGTGMQGGVGAGGSAATGGLMPPMNPYGMYGGMNPNGMNPYGTPGGLTPQQPGVPGGAINGQYGTWSQNPLGLPGTMPVTQPYSGGVMG